MNNHGHHVPSPGTDPQSALSLLVSAADSHDPPRGARGDANGSIPGSSFADTLRLRGIGAGEAPGASLEEQLLLQQQAAQGLGGAGAAAAQAGGSLGLLSQLRDHQALLSQLNQQQQLAQLLGLGGAAQGANNDIRQALAAAQFRQAQQAAPPQLSHADILALSRSGGLSGLSGMLGGAAGAAATLAQTQGGLQSELEGLQRLEELERRQRFLAATSQAAAQQQQQQQQQQQAAAASASPAETPATRPAEPSAEPPQLSRAPTESSAAAAAAEQQFQQQMRNARQQQEQQPPPQHQQPPPPAAASAAAAADPTAPSPKQSKPTPAATAPSAPPPQPAAAAPAPQDPTPPTPVSGLRAQICLPTSTSAAAAAPPEANKEELEKAPGSVIVPCRARGMPMDHNFKTAYFVIMENVKHGEELICSYFACRNAGIKFRYCSHCKVPVAKRNFRKRHKHGGEEIKGDDDSEGGDDDLPSKRGIPSQITATRGEPVEADGISSQSADSNQQDQLQHQLQQQQPPQQQHHGMGGKPPGHPTEVDVQQGLVRSSMRTFETSRKIKNAMGMTGALPPPTMQRDEKISDERQRRWVSLLGKRPSTKDGDSMSAWLMEVLAVSDLETPLKPLEDGTLGMPDEMRPAGNKKSPMDMLRKKDPTQQESDMAEMGYGSPGDDQHHQRAAAAAHHQQEMMAKMPATVGPFGGGGGGAGGGGGLVKKKRPADLLKDKGMSSSSSPAPESSFVSGSFAEWKERKRQKKQSKSGTPSRREQV